MKKLKTSRQAFKKNAHCDVFWFLYFPFFITFENSRIQETKHLSADADSSTDTTVGWTKNTQKPNFFEKRKKNHPIRKNSKTSGNMPKLAICPSTRDSNP